RNGSRETAMTDNDVHGRVALVTGGSRGIGAAIARALARGGLDVAVNYRQNAGAAQAVVDELKRSGQPAIAVEGDVSRADEVARIVHEVEVQFGSIDVLINNAGIAIRRGVDDLTEADFDATIAANLKSAFLCMQAVLPQMRARRWGRIVNISSGAARGAGSI